MVAFRQDDLKKISRLVSEREYAWSMNLGDTTIANGVIQVDLRGDYPTFTAKQMASIEREGFVRADTFWYEISPPPQSDEQRRSLLEIFNTLPSSTIAPSGKKPSLRMSFISALSDTQINAIAEKGMTIYSIPTVPLNVLG